MNNIVGELRKRQSVVEDTVYEILVPQMKKLFELIEELGDRIAKLENEKQLQPNTQKEE